MSRIVEITQTSIDRGIFTDWSDVMQVLDAIMTEARGTLMYRRQRQRAGGSMAKEAEEPVEAEAM